MEHYIAFDGERYNRVNFYAITKIRLKNKKLRNTFSLLRIVFRAGVVVSVSFDYSRRPELIENGHFRRRNMLVYR